jgi:hypothetical protein
MAKVKIKYKKNCPSCNVILYYSTKYTLKRAIENNSLCMSCAAPYNYDKWYESQPDKYCKDCGKGPLKFKHRCDECNEVHQTEKYLLQLEKDRERWPQKLRSIPKLCKRCDIELKERICGQQYCSDCAILNRRDADRRYREKNIEKRYCRDCGVSELEPNKKVCDDCKEKLYNIRNAPPQRYCKGCGVKVGKKFHYCSDCIPERIRTRDMERYLNDKGLFERKCPTCDSILEYKSRDGYNHAVKENSSCRSCTGKNNDYIKSITLKEKNCIICDKLFKPKRSGDDVCGAKCGHAKTKKGWYIQCKGCGNNFWVVPSEFNEGRAEIREYCSWKCRYDPNRVIGEKFGLWEGIERKPEEDTYLGYHYLFRCECGTEKVYAISQMRSNLKDYIFPPNCGCQFSENQVITQLNRYGWSSLEEKEDFIRKNGDYNTFADNVRGMTKRKLKKQLPDLWKELQTNPYDKTKANFGTGLTVDHLRPVYECWIKCVSMDESSDVLDEDGKHRVEIVTMRENLNRWIEYMEKNISGRKLFSEQDLKNGS